MNTLATDDLLRLTTGVVEMDRQHLELMEVAGELLRGLALPAFNPKDERQRRRIVREFTHLVMSHFLWEERLMMEIGYAQAASHREEHTRLTDEILVLKQRVDAGLPPNIDEAEFRRWLLEHVAEADHALAAALVDAGIR